MLAVGGGRSGTGATQSPEGGAVDETVVAQLVADLGPAAAAEVCRVYVADAREAVGALVAAFDAGDASGLARCAHRLKSASAFVGLGGIAALCRDIETGARQGRLGPLGTRVVLLAGEIEHATQELVGVVRRLSGRSPSAVT